MTVADLIALLSQAPQDARVIIAGYEGGYCDVEVVEPQPIRLNVNEKWYYGPHSGLTKDEAADEVAILIR